MTCALTWALIVVLLPVIILLWATESKSTRIKRLRRNGATWKTIAAKMNTSPSTARRWAKAS
jgi:hypothetical protein